MIIEINYRAIKWDNYQGACGMPYTDRLLANVDGNITLAEMTIFVKEKLDEEEGKLFTGEVELVSIVVQPLTSTID